MQVIAFIDYGITQARNPQPGEFRSYEIAGAGFGMRFDFGHDLSVKVDVGFPVAGPKPSSGDSAAVYVQAIKKF